MEIINEKNLINVSPATEENEKYIEQCKGGSKQWLIEEPSPAFETSPSLSSTMKESYKYPDNEGFTNKIGKRKAILLKKFHDEALSEIISERETLQKSNNDYCTVYDVTFNGNGFKPNDEFYKVKCENFTKYPLYSSVPASLYSFTLVNGKTNEYLPGSTGKCNKNPVTLFKKNANFTKPLSEKFVNDEW